QAMDWQGRWFAISALTGKGCQPLVYAIMEYLQELQSESEEN
ncbi:MAG: GTPase ObgE, partial [Nitrosomonas sp.]|nr:GTPase ObgE [Nitrosomonas sp.]